jgi:hypothetical protein
MVMSYEDALRKVGEDMAARSRAGDAMARAYFKLRGEVEPSGWVLQDRRAPPAGDHFLVGFAMRWNGRDVAECAFKVGPGRAVVFDRSGEPPIVRTLDNIGEAEFYDLLVRWAGEVQAAGPPMA